MGLPLGKGLVFARTRVRRFSRGFSGMFQLLRKSSIINRVFVSLVVMACLLAAVGASAAWWLQAQGEQVSRLAREARALDGGAAKKLADSADALAASSTTSAAVVAVATVVCTLLGIAAAAALRASIKYPVEALVDSAVKLAAGDFVSKIESPGRDEISWLCHELNMMRKKIRDSIKVVLEAAAGVRMTSHELAQGNSDLSSRTEAQAASLQQTSSSMTQLADKVKENASNAKQASNIVHETTDMATRGGSVMKQVVDRMGDINTSAQRIAEIIGVIDGIAFQTNILALNAAVEAARAGEAGRGFAVVAGEVRALAHRCATAAKEVKTLISDSVAKVDAGFVLVDEAGETMQAILTGVNRVSTLVNAIAEAGAAQGADIGEVHEAIAQMNESTQRNTAVVQQAASSAIALRTEADRLTESVEPFKVLA
jgi:methyl-accepting chemotaxis protein